jgi:hypothetical protein
MSIFLTGAVGAAAATEAILNTEPTEPAVDIASLKQMMDGFDPASLLPELGEVFGTMASICRIAVLIGPVVLLIMGLAYLFFSPKEANYYFGYRCYYGMGSVPAWRFTQRIAGIILGGLGLVLTGIMLMVSGGFATMQTMDMAWKALTCVLWEAGLSAVAILSINIIAAMTFDKRGEYRNRKKKK